MIDELSFVRIDQEEFQEIDYVVMGIAYELQNEMGTIFNEHIYRNELEYRSADKFETVNAEVPIPISSICHLLFCLPSFSPRFPKTIRLPKIILPIS